MNDANAAIRDDSHLDALPPGLPAPLVAVFDMTRSYSFEARVTAIAVAGLLLVVLKGLVSRDVKVGDLMTPNPYTVGLSGTADDVMATMTAKRFRHIPVVENGKVLGIVTIGDMVKLIVIQQEKTIKQLESYIAGDLAAE